MPKQSTILYPWLRGVVEITGEHDTGKTLAMLQTVKNFSSTLFVDDDIKGDGTVRQMADRGEFPEENYIDLSKERAKLRGVPTADEILNEIVFPLMERLTERRHDVIIFDTWRIVYQSARGHVERNQPKYANVVQWRGSSQIIQGLISKVARMIERDFIGRLKESCDLLILSHHLKANYVGGIDVGDIPESSTTFHEVCNMRIWLRKNTQSKVPVMLFLKRPNVPKLVQGKGLRASNIVPLKVTPTEKHESIWEVIQEYHEKPIESRQPRADETPTAAELAVISGTLTDEQRAYIKSMMDYNRELEKEFAALAPAQDTSPRSSPSSQDSVGRTESGTPDDTPSNAVQLLSRALALGYTKESMEQELGLSFAQINSNFDTKYWYALQKAKEKADEPKAKRGGKK